MSTIIYAITEGGPDDFQVGPYFFSKISAEALLREIKKVHKGYSANTSQVEEYEVFESSEEYFKSEHINEFR